MYYSIRTFYILTLFILSLVLTAQAQPPEGFNYQAVARDSEGEVLKDQLVSVRVGIISGSPGGTLEWEEAHAGISTNQFGLLTLVVGQGTSTGNGNQAAFADINWGAGEHYLKIELDHGSGYQEMGTSQLVSVPYAMSAVASQNALVADSATVSKSAYMADTTSFAYIADSALNAPEGHWKENGSDIYYDAGQVGVGAANPDGKLHISLDNIANQPVVVDKALGSGNGALMEWYGFGTTHRLQLNYTGGYEFNTDHPSRHIRFAPDSNQTMEIGDGHVNITGTNTFSINTLDVFTDTSWHALYANNESASSTSYGARLRTSNNGDNTTSGLYSYGRGYSTGGHHAYGVRGYAYNYNGTGNAYGVYGYAFSGAGNTGNAYAGYFSGNVHITGTLSKGGGSFKIDHPQDPGNKYLVHSFVESPDMMNVYNGNVETDENGKAVVAMPDYFEVVNKDFRYQLTVMGEFAQAIIDQKLSNGRFVIKTDKPNVEVSWQITGIRNDPWANENRIEVEKEKGPNEKGKYLHPELYGQPIDKQIGLEDKPLEERKEDGTR